MKYKKYIVILLLAFVLFGIVGTRNTNAQFVGPERLQEAINNGPGGNYDSLQELEAADCDGFYFLTGCTSLTKGIAQSQGFTGIFNTLLKVVIALAGIWAVIELSYYGAQYALVDSFTGKKYAIKNIWPIAYGLIALLATVLLFNQINPKIVENLNAPDATISHINNSHHNAPVKITPSPLAPKLIGGSKNKDQKTTFNEFYSNKRQELREICKALNERKSDCNKFINSAVICVNGSRAGAQDSSLACGFVISHFDEYKNILPLGKFNRSFFESVQQHQ